jgi:hypothetical protein
MADSETISIIRPQHSGRRVEQYQLGQICRSVRRGALSRSCKPLRLAGDILRLASQPAYG